METIRKLFDKFIKHPRKFCIEIKNLSLTDSIYKIWFNNKKYSLIINFTRSVVYFEEVYSCGSYVFRLELTNPETEEVTELFKKLQKSISEDVYNKFHNMSLS